MKISFNGSNTNAVYDFFSDQKVLKKLRLRVKTGSQSKTKALLFLILKNSPELREFELRCDCRIRFTISEFADFLRRISLLESLRLSCKSCVYDEGSGPIELQQLPSIRFDRLRTLRLKFERPDAHSDQICLEILKRCVHFRELHLTFMEDDTWQRIVEIQVYNFFEEKLLSNPTSETFT